ncbi:MAG: hypothetical protein OEY59_02445 [Deltaproteobacteria bacterium]|nr:hypothetical protein [Deltaproteobacteria bacterium]
MILVASSCEYLQEPEAYQSQMPSDVNHSGLSGTAKHGEGLMDPLYNCIGCHGGDLKGLKSAPSCYKCHLNKWDFGDTSHDVDLVSDATGDMHAVGYKDPFNQNCEECHGDKLLGSETARSCFDCHNNLWDFYLTPHENMLVDSPHADGFKNPFTEKCGDCHGGVDLSSDTTQLSCYACHLNKWDYGDTSHDIDIKGTRHAEGYALPVEENCASCHGNLIDPAILAAAFDITTDASADTTTDASADTSTVVARNCSACHLNKWDYGNTKHDVNVKGVFHALGHRDPETTGCNDCHGTGPTQVARVCIKCHGELWNLPDTHTKNEHGYLHADVLNELDYIEDFGCGVNCTCIECHGATLKGTAEGGTARTCYNSGCHVEGQPFDD